MISSHQQIKCISLLYLPQLLNFKDIKDNGLLLSDTQLKYARKYFKKNPDQIYLSKHDSHANFSVVRLENEIFAIYRGKQRENHGEAYLGKGGYGTVKLAQNLATGELVVLKTIQSNLEKRIDKHVLKTIGDREFNALTRVKLSVAHSVLRKNKSQQWIYQFIMKLAPGPTLRQVNSSSYYLHPVKRLEIAINVLEVFESLFHQKNLIHRDIKCPNVIVNLETGKVYPIDFSFAMTWVKEGYIKGQFCGTKYHIAPELYDQNSKEKICTFNEATEIYALGVTLIEWFGYDLNSNKGREIDIFNQHNANDQALPPLFVPDENARKNILSVLKCMLMESPSRRSTFAQIISALKNIKDNYLYLPARIQNVGFVQVNEVMKYNDNKCFIRNLKYFDQVFLVSLSQHEELIAYQAKMMLECYDIIISNQLYIYPNYKKLIAILPDYVDKQYPNNLYQYFFIDSKETPSNYDGICLVNWRKGDIDKVISENLYKQKVTDKDFNKISVFLTEEIERLNNKYPHSFLIPFKQVQERVTLLTQVKDLLSAEKIKNTLTYRFILSQLNILQATIGTNNLTYKLPTFFHKQTGSERRIENVQADLENDSTWARRSS